MKQMTWKIWLVVTAMSAVIHIGGMAIVASRPKHTQGSSQKVKIKIAESKPKPQPTPAPTAEPPQPTPPPKPKPKPKKKPPEPQKQLPKKNPPAQPPAPKKEVEPVQGFDKKDLLPADSKSSGPAVPVGNTLMVEDVGIRKDQVEEFQGDLSRDPQLVRDSISIPQYTDAAIDAAIEGYYIVDVYVDETGKVLQAELRRKIGYGMDDRILEAARKARFEPRLNKFGRPLAAWTEIKFDLRIP